VGSRSAANILELTTENWQLITPLFPKKRKKNPSQNTDLTDPEKKHPLDEIGAEVSHIRSEFTHFFSESALKALFHNFYGVPLVGFASLVNQAHQGVGSLFS
jgi:hypothetical protein